MKANQSFKNAEDAVSPVIGVILMVAITVVLAAVVFVLVSDLGSGEDETPQVTMTKSGSGDTARLTVQDAPLGLKWGEFTEKFSPATCVINVAEKPADTAAVTGGDSFSFTATPSGGCSGVVFSLVHDATNGVSYSTTL